MAPFRSRDRSNRSGRGQVEHNVLEGLPINQYREVEVTIGPNVVENKQLDKDAWPEPPMPRDSHLLPEHSQRILRAARSGRLYKPPAPPEEDKDSLEEEEEHKEVPQGFTVKKWVKVPRHLEDPEPEYLAKRRKGLPSRYVTNAQVPAQPAGLRETKVKKTDAEGNVSVYKVLVPEGQAVEGEIQATDAVIEAAPIAAAPGTVVEGVGVVNAEGVVVASDILQQTPPRRRPPPPKKKKKRSGPGRGKKKVVFVDGAPEQGTPASGTESGHLAVPGVKQEEGSVEPSEGGDTPMLDAGDEDEGSGEEGSDDDEHEEGTHSPTPAGSVPPSEIPAAPTSAPATDPIEKPIVDEPVVEEAPLAEATAVPEPPAPTPVEPTALPAIDTLASIQPQVETKGKPNRDPSSSPELPLSAMAHSRQNSLNQIPTLPTLEPPAPASELEPEPVSEPVPEPVHAPVPEPEPVLEPVPAPVPEPALEPVPAPEPEPALEPVPAPAPAPAPAPVSEPVPEPVLEPLFEPVLEPEPELVKAEEPAPVAEFVPAPVAEQLPVAEDQTAAQDQTASQDQTAAQDQTTAQDQTAAQDTPAEASTEDEESDLIGSLERQLDKDSEFMAAP